MDPNVLRAQVVEKGSDGQGRAERLSDTECYNLIFVPGFSTKTEISDVSGRGVGMDVVKTKISQLNGSINIYSAKGQGSKIVIKVPLTLAIMPTLMVMLDSRIRVPAGERQRNLPPRPVAHQRRRRPGSGDRARQGAATVLPQRWLTPAITTRNGHVVIVPVGNQRVGFVVDQLVGQEEVVIKPLGKMLQGTPGCMPAPPLPVTAALR